MNLKTGTTLTSHGLLSNLPRQSPGRLTNSWAISNTAFGLTVTPKYTFLKSLSNGDLKQAERYAMK